MVRINTAIISEKEVLPKQFVLNAIKNARFLLSPPETVRYIAKSVLLSVKAVLL
jgi:hypothetical protein